MTFAVKSRFLFLSALLFSLAGCGGGGAEEEAASTTQEEEKPDKHNNPPKVTQISSPSTTEGDSIVFNVSLSDFSQENVTFGFAISHIGTDNGDIGSPIFSQEVQHNNDGTITVATGVILFSVTIPTTDDNDDENDERFRLTIDNRNGMGTIIDNDAADEQDNATVTGISNETVMEGNPLNFSVTLSQATETTETYSLGITNGSADNSDYGNISFSSGVTLGTDTITVEPGVSAFTASVETVHDDAVEGDESFTINIGGQSGIGTITNDDEPAAITVTGITDDSVSEGETLTLNVTLSQATAAEETFNFNLVDGTADDSDYSNISFSAGVNLTANTITVDSGISGFSITIDTVQDDVIEDDETFSVNVDGQGAVATILNDDVTASTTITDLTSDSVIEGGTLTFNVTLSQTTESEETFSYSIANNSADDSDYNNITFSNGVSHTSNSITVVSGISSFSLSIDSLQDDDIENDETFTVNIGGQSAVGTIQNDDQLADSDDIIYVADQDVDDKFEIYTYSPTANRHTKINQALANCDIVTGVTWTKDLSRVVYSGDQDSSGVIELYSVQPDGSGRVKLNGSLVADGNVQSFKVSPDSTHVAYLADQDQDGVNELYTVSITGNNRTKVSGSLVGSGDVTDFSWSPDGQSLGFLADANTDELTELFAVDRDGTGRNRINAAMIGAGDVSDWQWTEDSLLLVYRADAVVDGRQELFSAAPDGSNYQALNDALVSIGSTQSDWQISPSSDAVLYLADHDSAGTDELFVVSLTNGNIAKLNSSLASGGSISHWQWSPDGNQVTYVADQTTQGVYDLYTVNPDGSNMQVLNNPLPSGGSFSKVAWSGDSARVFFSATMDSASQVELYSVLANGTLLTKLNDNLVAGASLPAADAWEASPNGGWVLYRVDQNQNDRFELFVVAGDGTQTASRLNNNLVNNGDVKAFSWSRNSQHILYLADQDQDETVELFLTDITAPNPTQINHPLTSGGDVEEFAWIEP